MKFSSCAALIAGLVLAGTANAQFGFFGPPDAFLDSPITINDFTLVPDVGLTVRQLTEGLAESLDEPCETDWVFMDRAYLLTCEVPFSVTTVGMAVILVWTEDRDVVLMLLGPVGGRTFPPHEIQAWLDIHVRPALGMDPVFLR